MKKSYMKNKKVFTYSKLNGFCFSLFLFSGFFAYYLICCNDENVCLSVRGPEKACNYLIHMETI